MEILICTDSKKLWKSLYQLVDNFLCNKKSRYMSVYSKSFTKRKDIFTEIKKRKSAIVILDVQSFGDWQEIAEEIESLSKTVKICLVSDTNEAAINAINNLKTVCGYICKPDLKTMFKEIFSKLYGKLRTLCGGVMVTHYNSVDKIIPFDDILLIETIKQTHMCTVVHKNGIDEIRADISKLINELPEIFQIVRSSTIANISEIKSYSDCKILFSDGSSCFCSKKYVSKLKEFMGQQVLI